MGNTIKTSTDAVAPIIIVDSSNADPQQGSLISKLPSDIWKKIFSYLSKEVIDLSTGEKDFIHQQIKQLGNKELKDPVDYATAISSVAGPMDLFHLVVYFVPLYVQIVDEHVALLHKKINTLPSHVFNSDEAIGFVKWVHFMQVGSLPGEVVIELI